MLPVFSNNDRLYHIKRLLHYSYTEGGTAPKISQAKSGGLSNKLKSHEIPITREEIFYVLHSFG